MIERSCFRLVSVVLLPADFPAHSTCSTTPRAPTESPSATGRRSSQESRFAAPVCERLEIGNGATIADIGAGNGRDTWVFASIVGDAGNVYSEEIEQQKCTAIEKEAKSKGLKQVEAVLGTDSDPKLPPGKVDMAFMHFVYHHFSKPRQMLQSIWHGLKPGGYLVIVDQRLGTLQDWVPRGTSGQASLDSRDDRRPRSSRIGVPCL